VIEPTTVQEGYSKAYAGEELTLKEEFVKNPSMSLSLTLPNIFYLDYYEVVFYLDKFKQVLAFVGWCFYLCGCFIGTML